MTNPFKLHKDKYIWYCSLCWTTGTIATNINDLIDNIKKTCYKIHNLTNITKCKAKINHIIVHKHKPIKKTT